MSEFIIDNAEPTLTVDENGFSYISFNISPDNDDENYIVPLGDFFNRTQQRISSSR